MPADMRISILAFTVLAALGCQQGKSKLDNMSGGTPVHTAPGSGGGSGASDAVDIDSKDILARPAGTEEVQVKHVLIGWKELDATVYHGKIDPRAGKRTNAEAATLAQQLADKLKAAPDTI